MYDAIRSGKSSIQSTDPFNDIAPLADSLSEGNPDNFVQLSDDLREGYVNNGALRPISTEMLLMILLLMMNSKTALCN